MFLCITPTRKSSHDRLYDFTQGEDSGSATRRIVLPWYQGTWYLVPEYRQLLPHDVTLCSMLSTTTFSFSQTVSSGTHSTGIFLVRIGLNEFGVIVLRRRLHRQLHHDIRQACHIPGILFLAIFAQVTLLQDTHNFVLAWCFKVTSKRLFQLFFCNRALLLNKACAARSLTPFALTLQ